MKRVTVTDIHRDRSIMAASLVAGSGAPRHETVGEWFTAAVVEVIHDDDRETTLICSRYDESAGTADAGSWIVDGLWSGSLPIYHNGVGSRFSRTKEPSEEVCEALNAALREAGFPV